MIITTSVYVVCIIGKSGTLLTKVFDDIYEAFAFEVGMKNAGHCVHAWIM